MHCGFGLCLTTRILTLKTLVIVRVVDKSVLNKGGVGSSQSVAASNLHSHLIHLNLVIYFLFGLVRFNLQNFGRWLPLVLEEALDLLQLLFNHFALFEPFFRLGHRLFLVLLFLAFTG